MRVRHTIVYERSERAIFIPILSCRPGRRNRPTPRRIRYVSERRPSHSNGDCGRVKGISVGFCGFSFQIISHTYTEKLSVYGSPHGRRRVLETCNFYFVLFSLGPARTNGSKLNQIAIQNNVLWKFSLNLQPHSTLRPNNLSLDHQTQDRTKPLSLNQSIDTSIDWYQNIFFLFVFVTCKSEPEGGAQDVYGFSKKRKSGMPALLKCTNWFNVGIFVVYYTCHAYYRVVPVHIPKASTVNVKFELDTFPFSVP